MRRISKGMCALILGATLSTMSYSALASVRQVIGGENRYSTAAKVAENGWKHGSNTAVIVNGEAIVDALSATPYAKYKDAPILLTQKDTIPIETRDIISKLGVSDVVIIGGEGVVSKSVARQLENMSLNIQRISGLNRYETASAVAHNMSSVYKVAVVNGVTGLADALSIAAPAARENMAIILSDGNKIVSGQDIVENAAERYVIGGIGVISDSLTNSISAVRLSGANRNATNAAVLEQFYPEEYISKIYIAKDGSKNQSELVDALTVGSLAGKEGSPVMLLGDSLAKEQENYLMPRLSKEVIQVGYGVNETVAKDAAGDLEVIGLPKEDKDKTPELKEVRARDGEVIATLTNSIDKVSLDDFYVIKQIDGGSKRKITPNKVILNDNKVDISLKMNEETSDNWNKRINYEIKYKNGYSKSCWFKIIHDGVGPAISINEIPSIVNTKEIELDIVAPKNDLTSLTVSNNDVKYYKGKNNKYTINLNEGDNKITILGVNQKGDITKINKTVICDTTPPKIITSKIPSETYDKTLRFEVTVNESCDIVVRNKEYKARYCGNGEYEIELNKGANSISIEARDKAGNLTSISPFIKNIVKVEPYKSELFEERVKLYGVNNINNLDLLDKQITIIEEDTGKKFTATYIKDSYKNYAPEFKLDDNNELEDAKEYKMEAEWGDFSKCKSIAKLKTSVVDKIYILNQGLTVGDRTIKTEAIDQYGEKIYLNKIKNTKIELRINDKKADIEPIGNDFRIVEPLTGGEEIRIQFFNNNKAISDIVKFTIGQGDPSKQTKIENLKLEKKKENQYIQKDLNEPLAIGDKVKLTAEVTDQYGNTLKDDLAEIKWIDKSGKSIIEVSGDNKNNNVYERIDGLEFEVINQGTLNIIAEIENKANIKYTRKVDYIDATKLSFEEDKIDADKIYSKTTFRIGVLKGNPGSKVLASKVKFENEDNVQVSAMQGSGINEDKVYIYAYAKESGECSFEIKYNGQEVEKVEFNAINKLDSENTKTDDLEDTNAK